MIDAALPLAAAAGPGEESADLVVEDAGYFYGGSAIESEQGDVIQLAASTARARVLKIDYAAHAIPLDQSLTWEDGQGVCLAYTGAAPDIGAFEHDGLREYAIPGTP